MLWNIIIPWLIPIFGILMWLVQNLQHELAHAIVAKSSGAKIIEIWPFPSKKLGYFSWAYVIFYFEKSPSRIQEGFISAAPFIAAGINMLLISLILGFHGMIIHPALSTFLCVMFVTNLVDSSYGLSTFYRKKPKISTDGWKFSSAWNIPEKIVRFVPIAWKVIFISAILLQLFLPR